MTKKLISITMTEEQAQLISDLLGLGTALSSGSIDDIWKYLPVRLDYYDDEPSHVKKAVQNNFSEMEKINKALRSICINTPPAKPEKLSKKLDLKDMRDVLADVLYPDAPFKLPTPETPQGKYPYIVVKTHESPNR